MNWLSNLSKSRSTKIVYSKKTLTVNGIIKSETTKPLMNQEDPESSVHPEYTLKEQKTIFEYFTLISKSKSFCDEVIEKAKGSFLVFCQHPHFKRFWKKINQYYDPDWRYNIKIMRKERKFVENMKNLLRKIVDNPSESYDFGTKHVESVFSLDSSLKKLQDSVLVSTKAHKVQLRENFYKFK